MKILVLGATGNVGSELVRLLSHAKVSVKAAVHMRTAGPAFGIHAEAVPVDLDNFATLRAALDGVDTVYSLTPVTEKMVDLAGGIVEECRAAGVTRIVRQSVIGAELEETTLGRWHRQAEIQIEKSGIPYTILRPNFFMQNWLRMGTPDGVYRFPLGTARISTVDARDIAECAAEVLDARGHDGKKYVITGPQALTGTEIAGTIAAECGRDIRYEDVSPEAARKGLEAGGIPPWLAGALLELYATARAGKMAVVTDTVEKLTGAPPRTVRTFAHDHEFLFKGLVKKAA